MRHPNRSSRCHPDYLRKTRHGQTTDACFAAIPVHRIATMPGRGVWSTRAIRKTRITHLHNRWILFTSFYELLVCELGVLVSIHVTENLVDALGRRRFNEEEGRGLTRGYSPSRACLRQRAISPSDRSSCISTGRSGASRHM